LESESGAKLRCGDVENLQEDVRCLFPSSKLFRYVADKRHSYREAATVLYPGNTFIFDSYKILSSFTTTIPPQRLASIRQVVLSVTHFVYPTDAFMTQGDDEELLILLGGLQGLREVCLRYCPREYVYISHRYLNDFLLLKYLEKEEKPREYAMFYEILEVQTGPEIGGMLFDG
jgi:hypothetical protein